MGELPRIIIIVGPTASGKSSLAIRLAKKIGGEIVSADSRLSYKGMDIGTAKPMRDVGARASKRNSETYLSGGVPHHLIDLVSPAKTLTLADYKKSALTAIWGILKRGRVPIVVGGTGLYVRAIVENLVIPEVPPNPGYRAFLQKKGKAWILARLGRLDPDYARRIGPNPRYATRALEVIKATGKPFSAQQGRGPQLFDALILGLDPGKEILRRRIARRIGGMLRSGLVEEVRELAVRYGFEPPSMTGIGYRELQLYLEGSAPLSEAKRQIQRNTERYAKRQLTWWRAMGGVEWHARPGTALRRAKKWLRNDKN